jgi:hypothetical protein
MAQSSKIAHNGSDNLENTIESQYVPTAPVQTRHQVSTANTQSFSDSIPVNSGILELLSTRNTYPSIPWITESWLAKLVRHERIAVASPRIGMGLIGTELIQQHINLTPTLHSPADFIHVHDERGHYLGVRPKMATWPLTKEDILKYREWSA